MTSAYFKYVYILKCVFVPFLPVLSYNWLPTLENGSEIIRCIGENVEFPWKLQWDPSVELLTGFSWTQHLDTKIILLATFKLQDRTFWIQSNTSFEDRLFHVIFSKNFVYF